MAVAKTALN
ncbi:hypothetical protein A2U01_0077478, partial [Trifolium medium]|nr:hypothetical protein [Trifolium medium]